MTKYFRLTGQSLMLPFILALLVFLQTEKQPPIEPLALVEGPIYLSTTIPTVAPTSAATLTATAAPTATPTPTPTVTRTPSPTPSPTITFTVTSSPSASVAPTPTPILRLRSVQASNATATPALGTTPLSGSEAISVRAPILMYHYVSIPPKDADIYRIDLSVTPENLDAQLTYLKEAGYTVISLEDLMRRLNGHGELPEKPVILTFDDGYADNYANAFPLLQKHGFTATFSLVTQAVDFNDPRYLSWDNVIEMHAAGMDFGSHTYRHLDLRKRDVDFLVYEILGSKEAIEERIQEPVRFFVYPSGYYDQLTLDVVASANFWGALTTQSGDVHTYADRFELTRIRIRGGDTLEKFINKLH